MRLAHLVHRVSNNFTLATPLKTLLASKGLNLFHTMVDPKPNPPSRHEFAIRTLNHIGHGYSTGVIVHLPDINLVVDECILFFNKFHVRYAPILMALLHAELWGRAIALLITLCRDKDMPVRPFGDVALNGAMCGINDKSRPPWPLEHFLSIVAALVPTWCLVSTHWWKGDR
ncbi:caffeoylshikimate esterase-like [Olea europaea subsp. europaea]|uniref:Caffeoylshikimate esterase-like n=1 Tax=Olea europaea subsp. europaea TaxID=158383 RepID=A0A8S0VA23_OLEEU|nr:caffeoylshikimate esterase-like [Olea europaea subsp. europaea]